MKITTMIVTVSTSFSDGDTIVKSKIYIHGVKFKDQFYNSKTAKCTYKAKAMLRW